MEPLEFTGHPVFQGLQEGLVWNLEMQITTYMLKATQRFRRTKMKKPHQSTCVPFWDVTGTRGMRWNLVERGGNVAGDGETAGTWRAGTWLERGETWRNVAGKNH